MSEKNFENKVKKYLKDQGCYFIKYWGGGMFTSAGVPDLLVCCNGRFVGVEIKAENGRVSQLQNLHIENIKRSGGIALVLYPKDFENFKKMIKDLKNDSL